MNITLYTKHDCDRCKTIKSFLNEKKIPFMEKDIDSDEVVQELVESEYIIENFCDEHQCIVTTPIVKVDGSWMYKEFFDEEGNFQETDALRILAT